MSSQNGIHRSNRVLAWAALFSLWAACGKPAHLLSPTDAAHSGGDDLSVVFGEVDMATTPLPPPCNDGLKCQQVDCGEGITTTLVGHVFAPNGTLPIYNALVYIPNAELDPFTPGVVCDVCSAKASGHPIVTALTDDKGAFRLENVPAGDQIPLVIQMGRWRRQVTIPTIVACQDNVLNQRSDLNLQRLPKNKKEGDIPQVAIAAGVYDPVECLLHKIGLDDSEFTNSMGKGRVHIWDQGGTNTIPPAVTAQTLYNSLPTMKKYDMIVLPCSGAQPQPMQQKNISDYTDAGGRLFATDLMQSWVNQLPWQGPISWGGSSPGTLTDVDQTFPKGKAFAKWLVGVGASPMLGKLQLTEVYGRLHTVVKPVQRWLSSPGQNGGGEVDLHFTFNTPIKPPPVDGGVGPQCGRVLYSSFHVSATSLNGAVPRIVPGACKDDPLTPQEKALAFMIFDLSACVQTDDEIPIPPIP